MVNANSLFQFTLRKLETQPPGAPVIGSFALGPVFGKLESFFHDANFLLPSTLRKLETQTLGRSVIGSFAPGHILAS